MSTRESAKAQAGRPLPAELGQALLQACEQHRAALEGFPLDALLRSDPSEAGPATLSLPVVTQLLGCWVDRLGADLREHPPPADATLVRSLARLSGARQALLSVYQLAQQLADEDCGRPQISPRQWPPAPLASPRPGSGHAMGASRFSPVLPPAHEPAAPKPVWSLPSVAPGSGSASAQGGVPGSA